MADLKSEPCCERFESCEVDCIPRLHWHDARRIRSESGDSELRLLRRACDTAFAFIESHVADPDITDEMVRKYADYQEARAALEGRK